MGEVVIRHGPAGSDRSRRLLEVRLHQCLGRPPGFLYVVSSRWRKHQLLQVFLKANPRTFEVPILTFHELVAALFREIGTGLRVASGIGRRCLLQAVLDEQLQAPEGDGVDPPLSLSEAESWTSLLKGRGLTTEPLIRLYLRQEDHARDEGKRLTRVFLAYQRKLEERGWEDAAGVRLRLYEALLTGSVDCRRRFPGLREFLFEGLVARTPVERGLVRLLADQVKKSIFSLDLESPKEEARPFSLPLSAVQECWAGMNPRWSFEAGAAPPPRPRFTRPPHREAEIRLVARKIQELKAGSPRLRWSQVGIVCPRDESYLILMKEIFCRLDVPWLNLHGDTVGSTNVFGALTGYVELLWRDFRREDLFDFLSSPWVGVDGISPEQVRHLERLACQGGFRGGGAVWASVFPDWIERKLSEPSEEPGSVLEGCTEVFRKLIGKLQADSARCRTAAEWVSLVGARLGPLLRAPDGSGNWGRTEGQALARLQSKLQEAALLWGDRPLNLARLRSLLHRQVSRIRISPSLDREAVVVGSARDLQECEFRHLFWVDFSEGRIPSRSKTPVSGSGSRTAEELSVFHGIHCRSRETVLLSSPEHTDNGPALPSHVLEYVNGWDEVSPHVEATLGPAKDAQRRRNVRRGVRALSLRRSSHPNAFAGGLSRPDVLDRMRRRHCPSGMDLSPVQLEEYGRCGFRYFVRTVLGSKAPPPVDSQLLREQRRLVLRVLLRYSQDSSADPSPGIEDGRRRMAEIARDEMEQSKQTLPEAGGLVWEQLRTWLMDGLEDSKPPGLLMRFLANDRERAAGSEVHSVEAHLGPLVLGHLPGDAESADGQAPVRLKGPLDRIERTPEGLQLVSYVAGNRNLLRRIQEGWGFRLPLSLLLVHSFLGKAASGGFYHVGLPGYLQWRPLRKSGNRVPAEDLEQLMERYRKEALLAARRIYSGTFPVTTHKPAAAGCAHCSYSRICRREEAQAGGTYV